MSKKDELDEINRVTLETLELINGKQFQRVLDHIFPPSPKQIWDARRAAGIPIGGPKIKKKKG